MQHWNNGFNRFKVDDSTHTYMLIVLKTWKNSINHFNIIAKHWVACVSIYCNRCKLQLVSNNFNTLKINGSIHVHIVESWKDF
jgi:hypothetical protein